MPDTSDPKKFIAQMFSTGRTVPTADPAHMKKVWEFMQNAGAKYGAGEIGVDIVYRDCGIEPDEFPALSFRLGMMGEGASASRGQRISRALDPRRDAR